MVEIFLKWNSLVVRYSIADEYGIGHSVGHYQTAVYFDICLHCCSICLSQYLEFLAVILTNGI